MFSILQLICYSRTPRIPKTPRIVLQDSKEHWGVWLLYKHIIIETFVNEPGPLQQLTSVLLDWIRTPRRIPQD